MILTKLVVIGGLLGSLFGPILIFATLALLTEFVSGSEGVRNTAQGSMIPDGQVNIAMALPHG